MNLKVYMKTWVMLLFFMAGTFSAGAAPVEKTGVKNHKNVAGKVTVTASADEITIADSIHLKVAVTVPEGYTIRFPSFDAFGFSTGFNERSRRFRVTNVTEIEQSRLNDVSTMYTQEFTLEPWLSGNYSILPIMISFFEKTGEGKDKKEASRQIPAFNVMTDGMRIKVAPLTDMRKELSGLYDQADYKLEKLTKRVRRKEDKSDEELLREQQQENETVMALKKKRFPWWIIWAILLLPLLVIFGRRLWKGRIAKIFTPKPKPAHEVAYKAFERLRSKDLPGQGKVKEFYYELSYILREYIGNRFGIYAVNQTTEEFFTHLLDSNPFDKSAEEILRSFSDLADTVKYSLFKPETKAAAQSFQTAKSFVDSTKVSDQEAA